MRNLIQINLDNDIYPKKAVLDTKLAFSRFVDSTLVPISGGVRLKLVIKPMYENDIRQIYCEFMNYLLDRTIQILIEKELS